MIFFFKQKTAYEMRISDWSSDVCSSDLCRPQAGESFCFDSMHTPWRNTQSRSRGSWRATAFRNDSLFRASLEVSYTVVGAVFTGGLGNAHDSDFSGAGVARARRASGGRAARYRHPSDRKSTRLTSSH